MDWTRFMKSTDFLQLQVSAPLKCGSLRTFIFRHPFSSDCNAQFTHTLLLTKWTFQVLHWSFLPPSQVVVFFYHCLPWTFCENKIQETSLLTSESAAPTGDVSWVPYTSDVTCPTPPPIFDNQFIALQRQQPHLCYERRKTHTVCKVLKAASTSEKK